MTDQLPKLIVMVQHIADSQWGSICVVPEHVRDALRGGREWPFPPGAWPSMTWRELAAALQASADLPRSLEGRLIQQWRERAKEWREDVPHAQAEATLLDECANDLEAALRQTAESRTSPVSSPPAPKGP